jgi:hypothetical protein
MSTLEEILAPQIDLTIDGLKRKRFTPDPISGKHYSKIASRVELSLVWMAFPLGMLASRRRTSSCAEPIALGEVH